MDNFRYFRVHVYSRDKLYKKFQRSKNPEDYKGFCKLRNEVQSLCKSAKSDFFKNQIEENKNKSKQLWNNFKKLGYQKDPKSTPNTVLNIDGENCFNSF